MDELSCPRCRMTKYRNPSLRLMINLCGHALCEACVELTFTRDSAPCPECGKNLKRSGFRTQLFEDTRVDKEVDIRKSILKIYNKQERDFSTLREYNDYLEEVEDIIWSLESGRNEKEIRDKIALYKQENEVLIRRNQVRINQERNYFKEQLARESSEQQRRALILKQMNKETEANRKREQEDLLNDLTNNTKLSTAEVLARHKKLKQDELSKAQFDGKFLLSDLCSSQAVAYVADQLHESVDPTYEYEPIQMDIGGPEMPNKTSVYELGYLQHVRETAARDVGGGYTNLIACERALYDAFGGLFLNPSCSASNRT